MTVQMDWKKGERVLVGWTGGADVRGTVIDICHLTRQLRVSVPGRHPIWISESYCMKDSTSKMEMSPLEVHTVLFALELLDELCQLSGYGPDAEPRQRSNAMSDFSASAHATMIRFREAHDRQRHKSAATVAETSATARMIARKLMEGNRG